MRRYRLNTTISLKHHEILQKYTEKYGTQRSVLEHALVNNSEEGYDLNREERIWMNAFQIKELLTVLPRDLAKNLLRSVNMEKVADYVKNETPVQFFIEWMYRKPIGECTLLELIEAMIININQHGHAETVHFRDEGDFYTLNIFHEMGMNGSKLLILMNEQALNVYGAVYETVSSERNVFIRVSK